MRHAAVLPILGFCLLGGCSFLHPVSPPTLGHPANPRSAQAQRAPLQEKLQPETRPPATLRMDVSTLGYQKYAAPATMNHHHGGGGTMSSMGRVNVGPVGGMEEYNFPTKENASPMGMDHPMQHEMQPEMDAAASPPHPMHHQEDQP